MIKRKIDDYIRNYYETNRNAMLITGARQKMKRTLTNEQYKKYVQLLNVTLKNKGLDSYMEDAANK